MDGTRLQESNVSNVSCIDIEKCIGIMKKVTLREKMLGNIATKQNKGEIR